MIPLEIIAWSVLAATVAWGLTLRYPPGAIGRGGAEASAEIRHAQAEAMRARARAAQLSRELASWTEGCRQGREDVLTLMPMLLAQPDPARIGSLVTEKDRPA